jgi:arginyl-tRNA synthetase
MKHKIAELVRETIEGLQKEKKLPQFEIPEILVEYPEKEVHGDYFANIAMEIGKITKTNPLEIANLLSSKLKAQSSKLFEKIEVAAPGFINFFLSKKYLQKQVEEILKKDEKFGNLTIGKNKKIQVEFISANPTGPLTVGNARGGPFGDVLANVLQKAGFEVEKAYYVNDLGRQVGALGHSVLKDDQAVYKGNYINELSRTVKEKDAYKAGKEAAKIIIEDYIKKTVQQAKIKFDKWYYESKLQKYADEALRYLKEKGFTYEKEGAVWLKSCSFGDERDRVLIKSDGSKTYLAGDLGFHKYKFEKKKFDKVINIWGADHFGDIPGLMAGVGALGHKGKLEIILLQFVTLLKKGEKLKISKRKGNVVTLQELLDEVGSDVVRFFFLQRSANTHLNFDLDLAREQSEKNPVYYVQYAYARICSILAKSKIRMPNVKSNPKSECQKLIHPSELRLIKQLIKFPEIIEDTAKDYQVQKLPQYAYELATSFHQFYRDCKVLVDYNPPTTLPALSRKGRGTSARPLREARIGLISATKIVLKNILVVMGISAPEKM